mgnify:CR=1 FL=1
MRPIKFTIKNGVTYFHYNLKDLREFIREGKKYGSVGFILTKRKGPELTYRGFGTIENPSKHITTCTFMYLPEFDGEMPSDKEIITPPKIKNNGNFGVQFFFLDFSKI